MIYAKDLVPKIYGESRDYQSILALLDLMIEPARHDTQYFINLLNPRLCPVSMLPLLASYVGYEYDNKESIDANRTIIEYFPLLIRNKGSEIGIALATALSVNALADNSALDMLTLFHIEYISEKDERGLDTGKVYIYIYYPNYLDKIRDMIEVVRPAGVIVELIPAIQISSIEQIRIYDEWRSFGYEFATGKLIRVDNHEIIMKDDQIINCYYQIFKYSDDSPSEYYIGLNNAIVNNTEVSQGYSVIGNDIINTNEQSGYKVVSGVITSTIADTTYDGYKIVSNRIVRPDDTDTGYTISIDGDIIDSMLSTTGYKLVGDSIIGRKVGYVEPDINGKRLMYSLNGQESGYYIAELPSIVSNTSGKIEATKYRVDKKGNVVDIFGNVALSWIDRYHVAESHLDENGRVVGTGTNRIGFSEVASRNIESGLRVDTYYYDKQLDAIVSVNNGVVIGGIPIEKYKFRDNRRVSDIVPQPYDPDYTDCVTATLINDTFTLTIPVLRSLSTHELFSTDQYDRNDPDTAVKFKLYAHDLNSDQYTEISNVRNSGYRRYEYTYNGYTYVATDMTVTDSASSTLRKAVENSNVELATAAVNQMGTVSKYVKINVTIA